MSRSNCSSQIPTPDYSSPSFRGALTLDHWLIDEESDSSMVPSDCIAEMSRASEAISTIARIVHNSLSEPKMSGAEPLGLSAHLDLLGGMEIIGKYVGEMADKMREHAHDYARFANEKAEADHE